MAKSPKDPQQIVPELVSDYKNLFGGDLLSIILYGSATGPEYNPGKSDINFLILLSEEGINKLDLAFSTVRKWRKRGVAVPLLLTKGYVESSLDIYPIEYLNLRNSYEVVFGEDILKDLKFDHEHLRLQCEREIKGKLLLLRESFLESLGKGNALQDIIRESLPAFLSIFEALLYLKGKEPPQSRRELIGAISEEFETDKQVFERLIDLREGKIRPKEQETMDLFKGYLREVRKLSIKVDASGG